MSMFIRIKVKTIVFFMFSIFFVPPITAHWSKITVFLLSCSKVFTIFNENQRKNKKISYNYGSFLIVVFFWLYDFFRRPLKIKIKSHSLLRFVSTQVRMWLSMNCELFNYISMSNSNLKCEFLRPFLLVECGSVCIKIKGSACMSTQMRIL